MSSCFEKLFKSKFQLKHNFITKTLWAHNSLHEKHKLQNTLRRFPSFYETYVLGFITAVEAY